MCPPPSHSESLNFYFTPKGGPSQRRTEVRHRWLRAQDGDNLELDFLPLVRANTGATPKRCLPEFPDGRLRTPQAVDFRSQQKAGKYDWMGM